MVEVILKKLVFWNSNFLDIQTKVNNWITIAPSGAEVSLVHDRLSSLHTKLSLLSEDYHVEASDEQIAKNKSSFDTYNNGMYNLQVVVGKWKKAIDDSQIARSKSTPFKLEKIPVPSFNGQFSKWQDFKQLFESAVVNNNILSDHEKMVYLKQALQGESQSIVSSFGSDDSSFKSAWELINKRYYNPREIIFANIRNFDELKSQQDSAQGLRKVSDSINELVRALNVLKVPVKNWDLILIYWALKKLEPVTKREWLLKLGLCVELPKLQDFIDFLEARATALADSSLKSKPQPQLSSNSNQKSHVHHESQSSPNQLSTYSSKFPCIKCGSSHALHKCREFIALPISDRKRFVQEKQLCFNCLFNNHTVSKCPVNFTCKKCKGKHHTLLHLDRNTATNVSSSSSTTSSTKVLLQTSPVFKPEHSSEEEKTTASHSSSHHSQGFVALLQTALVDVENSTGERQTCRIFLDNGAESNFISENCITRLGLKRMKSCVRIGGIGGTSAGCAHGITNIKLHSKIKIFTIELKALIMPKITGNNLPKFKCNPNYDHIKGLQLADPNFHQPGPIDILIGTKLTGKLKLSGFISGPVGFPDAQNTVFGWVLSGEAPISINSSFVSSSSFNVAVYHSKCNPVEPCLDSQLTRFWDLEEVDTKSHILSSSDQLCEKIYQSTVSRNQEGRYIVSLPFINYPPQFGESRNLAVKRLYSVEKTLSKNADAHSSYHKQIEDFISNGWVEDIPVDELNSPSYYMPHHIISKLDSTSSKYRIVFDASAKSSNGSSLNDTLLIGPKIQIDLFPLLIRFRTHQIAMSADIVKFYNQIVVHNGDSNYQRFIYRENSNQIIKDYRFKRVCFGVKSAPYLAVRTLHQIAEDYRSIYPSTFNILKNEFLIDNLLYGADSLEEAIFIQKELVKVIGKGKMKLTKWSSNSSFLMSQIPMEDHDTSVSCELGKEEFIKTIGILWNPINDSFGINIHGPILKSYTTKREILSSIARIFDPLGWLSPVTIRPKVLIQDLWKAKLGWDTPVPISIYTKWKKYCNDLPLLKQFTIPRRLISIPIHDSTTSTPIYELHGFCDASFSAYSAVVYLKTISTNRECSVELISAKSKVSPVKGETIPRLELCGAALLSKLLLSVSQAFKIPISSVSCYSDSTSVLDWLKSEKKLPVFQMNRVITIQNHMPSAVWSHVPGEENPADPASRGISAKTLLNHPLWLNGPPWLKSKDPVPIQHTFSTLECPALNRFQVSIITFIQNTSSFLKMKRLIGYWIRFINNCKSKGVKETGQLTVEELKGSLNVLVKVVQQSSFHHEFKRLSKSLSVGPKIKSLVPFIDTNGIIRVGGRLRNSFFTYQRVHPILLPKSHKFCKVIANYLHHIHLHPGPQLLLSIIRHEFWILRGADICKQVVRECVICHRANPNPMVQLMGQLPSHRVQFSRPFTKVGVDYAGPFYVAAIRGRNPRILKAYRFVSRRGLPTIIICDGGKNFIGAKNEIEAIMKFINNPSHQSQTSKYFADQGVKYIFNPPSAPHHGGIFEAGVKSMKHHLSRVVGDRHLSIEEFITILAQIEATLNSRPITPMSSDPNDFDYLTPGHFIIGGPLKAIPQENVMDFKDHQLTRWQHMQQIFQHFNRRWCTEYLQSLLKSTKWFEKQKNLGVGMLVLLNESDSIIGPQKWKLGRITSVHKGIDGLVRVCQVKVVNKGPNGEVKESIYTRSITKISPLPIVDNN